jgi:phospholipid-binding lipoprotein MlaA
MKRIPSSSPFVFLVVAALALSGCASAGKNRYTEPAPVGGGKSDGKSVKLLDDLDEYDTAAIFDPLEPLNRATFWLNDQIYTFVFRPVSKGYETIVPKVVRSGVHNAFENVKYPVRLVNNALQGNFKRAGQETGRFLVNSTVGIGGLGRPADHIPALADVPTADTAQTFSKWGIGHGAYLVLPVLGPSSLRDTVGLAGDYALNPVNWVSILYGGYTWTIAIPSTNSVRSLPVQLGAYDAAIKNSLDRYLAARSSYVQYRAEAAAK